MSFFTSKKIASGKTESENALVKTYYELYAQKLLTYTQKNYTINEDDAWTLVYKTIYKMAEVTYKYHFEDESKKRGFVFRTHINFIKNYYRDNKSFEHKNFEVELADFVQTEDDPSVQETIQLKVLQAELEKLAEWERILLLMRGQGIPYSDISAFVHKPEKQLKVYYARLKKQLLENVSVALNKRNTLTHEK